MQGMRVDVYRNLNDDCISVRCKEPGHEDYDQVIAHVDSVTIDDPRFVVQDAGREKVREEERKNVHAFVRGVVDPDALSDDDMTFFVNYDPYEMDQFQVLVREEPVEEADAARVTTDGVEAAL